MSQKLFLALAMCLLPSAVFASTPRWELSGGQYVAPSLSHNTAGLVFVRANQARDADSSTNIGVNDRFLVSLQDGHYASTVVCAGTVALSAVPTKAYSNDLSANAFLISLPAGYTQYVFVDVDDNYNPSLRPMNEEEAKQLLGEGLQQAHQRSRSFADNCPL